MLGWTAWNAWHRRRMVVLSAVVTATLLVCDAWFDIVLDWGTRHLAVSVATAVLAELPLAALLLARRRSRDSRDAARALARSAAGRRSVPDGRPSVGPGAGTARPAER